MGGSPSTCTHSFQNPDLLNVVTLSDSAVQRLPLDVDDNPLEKEQRKQNIDDYWRDRMECLENTYSESKRMTEKEFMRLEYVIKKMSPGSGKLSCPRPVEDSATCFLIYSKEPLKCNHLVRKLELCMDTMMAERSKKQQMDEIRKAKKRLC